MVTPLSIHLQRLRLESCGQSVTVLAGVSDMLLVSVLLRRDILKLVQLISSGSRSHTSGGSKRHAGCYYMGSGCEL